MENGTELENIKSEYKKRGVIFFNYGGIFYYKGMPCEKVSDVPEGKIVEKIDDYPAGNYLVFDNGHITGKTICGDVKLMICQD